MTSSNGKRGGRFAARDLALVAVFCGIVAALGVVPALAECAKDPRDIFLREQVAHALIFWEGSPEEQKLAEDTLLVLARDLGAGHDNRIELPKEE